MLKKLRRNLVFSLDVESYFKSLWIGPLLVTWSWDDIYNEFTHFSVDWYGLDYWGKDEEVRLE